MNTMMFCRDTGKMDWIPDRVIGLTEDTLYEVVREHNDREVGGFMWKSLEGLQGLSSAKKLQALENRIFSPRNKQIHIHIPIPPCLHILARGIMSFDQMVRHEPESALLNLVDTQCGDRQMPSLKAFDPTLGLEVPQVELNQFGRSVEETGYY